MDALVRLIREGSRRLRPLPTGASEQGLIPRNPRAILFDVYGTLLARIPDSHPRPAARDSALRRLVDRYRLDITVFGLQAALGEAIAAEHEWMSAQGVAHPEVKIEGIWQELFPGRAPEELRTMITEYELASHPAWPMPGCRGVLAALRKRGIRLGIISNAQFYTPLFLRALLGASLETLGFSPSLCLYSCDLGIAKPDQALFDLARERLAALGATSEMTLMIGNNVIDDISPARESGFMTILAALDRRSFTVPVGTPARKKPDAVVTTLGRVEVLLEQCAHQRGFSAAMS